MSQFCFFPLLLAVWFDNDDNDNNGGGGSGGGDDDGDGDGDGDGDNHTVEKLVLDLSEFSALINFYLFKE